MTSNNQKVLLGSDFVFTNRSGGNVQIGAGPNETLVMRNTTITTPYIQLFGGVTSGSLSSGIATQITNSVLNTTQNIQSTSSDISWDSTNSKFSLNRIGGTYAVNLFVSFPINSSGSREAYFLINDVNVRSSLRLVAASTVQTQVTINFVIPNITATTTVSAWVVQDSGSTLAFGNLGCRFECYRIG